MLSGKKSAEYNQVKEKENKNKKIKLQIEIEKKTEKVIKRRRKGKFQIIYHYNHAYKKIINKISQYQSKIEN